VFSDYEVEAEKDNNNGNNGCENANPNSKACEKNPNTEPEEASIDPTESLGPFDFTITDPQGRIQVGDIAVFVHNGDPPFFGYTVVATNITISPDGTTLT